MGFIKMVKRHIPEITFKAAYNQTPSPTPSVIALCYGVREKCVPEQNPIINGKLSELPI